MNKISKSDHRWWGIKLISADDDNDTPHFWINGFGYSVIIDLPKGLLKSGLAPYWDGGEAYPVQRTFGFLFIEDSLVLSYGNQDCDGAKRIQFDLPWLQRKHLKTLYHKNELRDIIVEVGAYGDTPENLPTREISFTDFDGELITGRFSTYELHYTRGNGWCSWLKYLFKNEIFTRMDVEFDSEVGEGKHGNWKGGMRSINFVIDPQLIINFPFSVVILMELANLSEKHNFQTKIKLF